MRQPCCFFVRSVSFHLSLTVIVCDQAPPFIKAASKRGQRVLAHYAEREQTRESLFSPKGRGWGGNVDIQKTKTTKKNS